MGKRDACGRKQKVIAAQRVRCEQKKLDKAFKRDEKRKAAKKVRLAARKQLEKEAAAKQKELAAAGRDEDMDPIPYGSVVEAVGLGKLKVLNGVIGLAGKEEQGTAGKVLVHVQFPAPHGERVLRRSNLKVCPEGTPAPSIVIKHPDPKESAE
eukprot:TRINITY_DN3955_c6_g1_i1.p2 TRINITY_DN3955_c6_g1~~TRINITY_DN3955_c6_g1_i1.p2  ORF type:complete len:153 (+),score=51.57 TRINITY_DN3955_c6_g1_i1:97-555(+)